MTTKIQEAATLITQASKIVIFLGAGRVLMSSDDPLYRQLGFCA